MAERPVAHLTRKRQPGQTLAERKIICLANEREIIRGSRMLAASG